MYKNIIVETDADREFVKGIVKAGDVVQIAYSLDDTCCPECSYEIGLDDEMYEDEGRDVEIKRLCTGWEHLSCKAKVFTAGQWTWSTCWIDRFYPTNPPKMRWQI